MTDAPEERTPGTEETRPPEPEGGSPPAPRGRVAGLWAALILLGLFAVIQGGGVLLRDRLEDRRGVDPGPPQVPQAAAPAPASPLGGARFGPEVREVVVASAPGPEATPPAAPAAPSPAAAPAPEPPAPAPPPPAPQAAQPAPAPAAPPVPAAGPAPAAEPTRAGGYVLQMGVFRSQKYRREMEERLDRLSIPHFRVEGKTGGASFRLAVAAADDPARQRARKVLDGTGYAHRDSPEGVEARFFVEDEAQHALDLLARAGLKGGYLRVEGETPLWTVYAGPYTEEEARETRQRLTREGLDSFLRRRP